MPKRGIYSREDVHAEYRYNLCRKRYMPNGDICRKEKIIEKRYMPKRGISRKEVMPKKGRLIEPERARQLRFLGDRFVVPPKKNSKSKPRFVDPGRASKIHAENKTWNTIPPAFTIGRRWILADCLGWSCVLHPPPLPSHPVGCRCNLSSQTSRERSLSRFTHCSV